MIAPVDLLFLHSRKKKLSDFCNKRPFICILFFLLFFFHPAHLPAQAPVFLNQEDGPVHLSADHFSFDPLTGNYTAKGNIHIRWEGKTLYADEIVYDRNEETVFAKGNISFFSEKDVLTGDTALLDIVSQTATITHGSLFLQESGFRIRSESIQKTGEKSYSAQHIRMSTCSGEPPLWSVSGRRVNVTLEGYGIVRHAFFRVKDFPVLYSPILIFPAKEKRQTGLLVPRLENAERKGMQIDQPVFWAISDQADATFYFHAMEKRGLKLGGEFRYALSPFSKGAFFLDYLKDEKTDHGLPSDENWGFFDDAWDRTNQDRFWFRMKADQELPCGFMAFLDMDIASDQDMLAEFKDGYSGYDETNAYFVKNFKRDLDDYTDTLRTNSLVIRKSLESGLLTGGVYWQDDVVAKNRDTLSSAAAKLPFLRFQRTRMPFHLVDKGSGQKDLFQTRVHFSGDSHFAGNVSPDGIEGENLFLSPALYFPIYRFMPFLFVEPSIKAWQTLWNIHTYGKSSSDTTSRDNHFSRYGMRARVDCNTRLSRRFAHMTENGIIHVIEPSLVYSFADSGETGDFPVTQETDYRMRESRVTFKLLNVFLDAATFEKKLRFEISQGYDISDYQYKTERTNAGVAPLFAELSFFPADGVILTADAGLDHEENRILDGGFSLDLTGSGTAGIFAEYRYESRMNESIHTSGWVFVGKGVTLTGGYETNFRYNREIASSVGLIYSGQCFGVEAKFTRTEEDKKFGFLLHLKGIGGLGSG